MSILFDDSEKNLIQEEIHPLSYYASRQYEMNNLKDQVQFDKNLLTGVRNSKLQFYLNEYQQRQQVIDDKYKEQQRYLKPEHYDTLFDDNQVHGDQDLVYQQQQEEKEKQRYYEEYVLNPQKIKEDEEKKQVCIFNAIEKERTAPQTNHLLNLQQDWLQDLRKEMRYIQQNNRKLIKKTKMAPACQNIQLIKKLAPTINNSMRVYFDEIFNALMDEILTEEAYFLNDLEQQGAMDMDAFDYEEYNELEVIKQQKELQKRKQQYKKVQFNKQKQDIQLQEQNNLKEQNIKQYNNRDNLDDNEGESDSDDLNKRDVDFIQNEKNRNSSPLKYAKTLASQQKIPIDLINVISELDYYGEEADEFV